MKNLPAGEDGASAVHPLVGGDEATAVGPLTHGNPHLARDGRLARRISFPSIACRRVHGPQRRMRSGVDSFRLHLPRLLPLCAAPAPLRPRTRTLCRLSPAPCDHGPDLRCSGSRTLLLVSASRTFLRLRPTHLSGSQVVRSNALVFLSLCPALSLHSTIMS